jgi:hypothetical protein
VVLLFSATLCRWFDFWTRPQLLGKFAKQAVKALSLAKAKSLGELAQENESFLISAQPEVKNHGLANEIHVFSIG